MGHLCSTSRVVKLLFTTLFVVSCQSNASDLDIEGQLSTEGFLYRTKLDSSNSGTNEVISIAPSVKAIYSSKRLELFANVDHTKVEQIGSADADKDYTEFTYSGLATLIENSLFLSINSAESYRVTNLEQNYISDKVLASGDLTKLNTNTATLNFVIPNPEHIGLTLQSSYSETKSDESLESESGLDSSNTSISASISEGREVENVSFSLTASYNDTARSSFQDFSSTQLTGSIGLVLSQELSFIIQTASSEYDVDTSGFSTRTNLDTTSYGAGITWQPNNDRSITITYNNLEEGTNETNYVGLDLEWAFSSRTALNLNYGKQFYGDAYGVDFSHNLKYFRSSLSYTEQVTSFSSLSFGDSSTSLFVCPIGSIDLIDCFQPSSTTYQLQAGEEFLTSIDVETDISEEILLRKSGSFSVGYDKRRIKTVLTLSYNETEYLESGQLQTTRRANLVIAYELGRKTNLSFTPSLTKTQSSGIDNSITTLNVALSRDLGQNLKMNIGARWLDRDSDSAALDVQDKRLTLGLTYTF